AYSISAWHQLSAFANMGVWNHRWRGEVAEDSARFNRAAHQLRGTGSGGGAENDRRAVLWADNGIHRELHPRSRCALRRGGSAHGETYACLSTWGSHASSRRSRNTGRKPWTHPRHMAQAIS